jgi:hypothetical protein
MYRAMIVIAIAVLLTLGDGVQIDRAQSSPNAGVVSFYPIASSLTQSPPPIDRFAKVCERTTDSLVLSIWAAKGGTARLAVFTPRPITKLAKVVSLQVLYTAPPRGSGAMSVPTARPGPDASLDWAYVFDRNGDGAIDYIASLVAARPVEGESFPADYPTGTQPIGFKEYELFIRSGRLVFTHYADDNFDGTVDAIVAPLPDPDRPAWVRAYGVLRSSHFDGAVDDEWAFAQDIAARSGDVPRVGTGYEMVDAEPPRVLEGSEWLAKGTALLGRINEAVRTCGMGPERR